MKVRNLGIALLVVLCSLAYRVDRMKAAGGTALGNLAASMPAGSWAELQTSNIDAVLKPASGSINIVYTDDIVYNPGTKEFFLVGSEHCMTSQFMSYSETSNSWTTLPRPSFFPSISGYCNGMGHGYDHGAVDQTNGIYYNRIWNTTKAHSYNIAARTWDQPAMVPLPSPVSYT